VIASGTARVRTSTTVHVAKGTFAKKPTVVAHASTPEYSVRVESTRDDAFVLRLTRKTKNPFRILQLKLFGVPIDWTIG
jgi:hypothetical protein